MPEFKLDHKLTRATLHVLSSWTFTEPSATLLDGHRSSEAKVLQRVPQANRRQSSIKMRELRIHRACRMSGLLQCRLQGVRHLCARSEFGKYNVAMRYNELKTSRTE